MEETQFCIICRRNNNPPKCPGYLVGFNHLESCPFCLNNELKTFDISSDDIMRIADVSQDESFIDAMVELKQKDPIEYQLKMSQFKNQVAQQEQLKRAAEESAKPHCPHCNSTNISKIGAGERAASIAVLGVFSKKINKSFKCKDCGYTW